MKCRRTRCQRPHDNCRHTQTGDLYCEGCAVRINRANSETPGLIDIPRARVFRDTKQIQERDWAHWPACPLKRDRKQYNNPVGFLVDSEEFEAALKGEGRFTVYLGTIYSLPEDFSKAPTIDYPTLEAMFADGWTVD